MAEEEFSGFSTPFLDFDGEPLVGATIDPSAIGMPPLWLCWDEVVALHEWLGKLIKAAGDG